MGEHYFSESSTPDERSEISARIWEQEYTFTTSRGVFSRDQLDKATALLLERNHPPHKAKTVLDLGCGWGPIGCAIAVECPDTLVHAVDVNRRALDLVRENATRLGVADRVRAYLPDDAPPTSYDEIWSNPPIRIGKTELHAMLMQWLRRLAPHGAARLVVGRNLGADSLQRWLTDNGYPTQRIASAKGFRVLRAEHAR